MSETYTVYFKNSTKNTYHFTVYQKYPESPGLDSVAWQVRGLGPDATNRVDWTLGYDVAIADWDANDCAYSGQEVEPAQLGSVYEVTTEESDIPVINTTPIDTTGPGLILLCNNTKPTQNVTMGFAIDKLLVAVEKDVNAGETVEFSVHPEYYIACYRSIKQGQLVSAGIELGPVKLEFKDGYTAYNVEVTNTDGRFKLQDPVPVPN